MPKSRTRKNIKISTTLGSKMSERDRRKVQSLKSKKENESHKRVDTLSPKFRIDDRVPIKKL